MSLLVSTIHDAGGRTTAVGGCVRDYLLGLPSKDIDIEVYGLSRDKLESVLKRIGSVYAVGQSFGVFKITLSGVSYDVSLPRTENKSGRGHKGFVVETDPYLTFEQASLRRDFTINAMGIDLSTGELFDPHGGRVDLQNKILRHVSDAFDEDPLRVLRACQFAARFDLKIHHDTIIKCQNLQSELPTLPVERIYEEIKKLLLAKKPSRGLEIMRSTGALILFSELEVLIDCPQEPQWHPEGDVWIHTLMVTDCAAQIICRESLDDEEALIIVTGALCHDLGKPSTTQFEDGRVRSKGHESAGEAPTKTLLAKMGFSKNLIDQITPLVRDHLKPMQLYKVRDTISDAAIRRLSNRISIERLCLVAEADFLGRTTDDAKLGVDPSAQWLRKEAERLSVSKSGPEPVLLGRHLIEQGYAPGPKMGRILAAVYDAQIEGEIASLEDAMRFVSERYK